MSGTDGSGFDAIVVGGGWGGLAAGSLLTRRGLEVLLLESRSMLGGRSSYEERDGFLVDYGIHAHRFGSKGAAARVYRALGEELELLRPGSVGLYHEGKLHRATISVAGLLKVRMLSTRAKLATAAALARLLVRSPGANYDRSVASLLPRRLNKEARFMISRLTAMSLISPDLEVTSAGEFIWFLHRVLRAPEPATFPRGGCRQHVVRLGGIIEESGEIRIGSRVDRVQVEGGVASGVECGGEKIRSRAVVLAVPLQNAAEIIPRDVIPAESLEYMRRIAPTSGLSWDVGLTKPVSDIDFVGCTEPLILGAFTSNFDPTVCPSGKQLSTWCLLLPRSAFEDPEGLKQKEELLRSTVITMFPSIEDNIQWERMIRLPVIDGAIPAATQPWPSRPGPADSGVPGLFFAGDTIGVPGQGGDIAFRSALDCAEAVISYLE